MVETRTADAVDDAAGRPAAAGDRLAQLARMIGSRGIDQFALGATSLLIARRLGTTDFAPFATLYILYSLAGQVADLGLGVAVLRTPRTERLRSRTAALPLAVGVLVAISGVSAGLLIGGTTGTVVAFGGVTWLVGGLVHIGRATLQWEGASTRLARGEATGAIAFLLATVAAVYSADHLLLFAGLLIGKQILELAVQGLPHSIFASDGKRAGNTTVWAGQVLTYLTANVDYLLVGTLLGAEALSVYAIAFRLASAFSSIVSIPVTRTAFTRFANTSDLQHEHDAIGRQIVGFGALGLAGTAVVALLLPTVLGPDWSETRVLTLLLGAALPWRLLLGPIVALAHTAKRSLEVVAWELGRMLLLTAALITWSSSVTTITAAASMATAISIVSVYVLACRGSAIRPSRWVGAATVALLGVLVFAGSI